MNVTTSISISITLSLLLLANVGACGSDTGGSAEGDSAVNGDTPGADGDPSDDAGPTPDAGMPDGDTGDPADVAADGEPSDLAPPQDEGGFPDMVPTVDVVEDVSKPQPTEPPPIEATYSTWIGDWDLAPGQEVTRCALKKLDNPEPIWVTAVHTTLAQGSHHMIAYKTDETTEKTDPFECTPFIETLSGQAYPMIITQIAEETMAMPPGVAVRLEPHQMIRLEAHFLNYYPEDITAHGEVSFDTIAAEDVWKEANMLFYGSIDIEIPPGEVTTPWNYLPVSEGVEVFAITGHTHQMGTNVEVELATNVEEAGTPIYPLDEPFAWDEAPVTQYDPPLYFDGDNGFRFRCSWNNTTGSTLGFGESGNDEMCFLWAYYYPSEGYQVCVTLGDIAAQFGLTLDTLCCPGNFLCDLIPGLL